ncbi:MAG: hypothetical protein ACE5HF_10785 [Gemmatimonadota bacterium]
MYPGGHPSLGPLAEDLAEKVQPLLVDRARLSIGVARGQLVVEGVATDPDQPRLRSLAERLHRHELGAVTFARGVEGSEIDEMLGLVSVEAELSGKPLGDQDEVLVIGPHLELYPLRYERLRLGEQGEEIGEAGSHLSDLWVGLARAVLAQSGREVSDAELRHAHPKELARALAASRGGAEYDREVVSRLLAIAEELASEPGGDEARRLREGASELVASVQAGTLQRLLYSGDPDQRRRLLLGASRSLGNEAVFELLRAALVDEQSGISRSMLRFFLKLARFSGPGRGAGSGGDDGGDRSVRPSDAAMRERIRELIGDWDLEDPNPAAYDEALIRMALGAPMTTMPGAGTSEPDPLRVVRLSLEVGVPGAALPGAVDEAVAGGETAALVGLLDDPPPGHPPMPGGAPAAEPGMAAEPAAEPGVEPAAEPGAGVAAVAAAVWERLSGGKVVRRLVEADPPDFETLDRLLPRVSPAAADDLLDVLSRSQSRSTRRQIFERIPRLGPAIGPLLIERLEDERWFVKRNVLALLAELETLPEGFSALAHADHDEAAVRLEALRLALRMPHEREEALLRALADRTERIVRAGLKEAETMCSAAALPDLARLAHRRGLETELRVSAIRALRCVGSPAARDALLRLARGRARWLFRRRLAPRSAEMLAALSALASGWPEDPAVRPVLERAARSSDPEIRAAAGADATGAAGGPAGGGEPGGDPTP